MVVGQRDDAGAEPDMARARRRVGDEELRAGDDLEAAGMMLADPGLVVAQHVEMLEQLHVAFERLGRVLLDLVKGCEEDPELEEAVGNQRKRAGCSRHAILPPLAQSRARFFWRYCRENRPATSSCNNSPTIVTLGRRKAIEGAPPCIHRPNSSARCCARCSSSAASRSAPRPISAPARSTAWCTAISARRRSPSASARRWSATTGSSRPIAATATASPRAPTSTA